MLFSFQLFRGCSLAVFLDKLYISYLIFFIIYIFIIKQDDPLIHWVPILAAIHEDIDASIW